MSRSTPITDPERKPAVNQPAPHVPQGTDWAQLAARVDRLLTLAEVAFDRWGQASTPPQLDFKQTVAFRWRGSRNQGGRGQFDPVRQLSTIRLEDLQHVERQKALVVQNTQQFVHGLPANDVLLTGARGTGKSSLIKACLNAYSTQGLRLIEVDRLDMGDLPAIVDHLAQEPYRFIVFCDDLSFESGDPGYKALKVVLDGSVASRPDNVVVYATSNRRHLLPEYMKENLEAKYQDDGEIHPGESVEEKISLSERFGLWVSYYPFKQDEYWEIVQYWLKRKACPAKLIQRARSPALQWALERGSRSGRVASQFAADWAGRHGIRPVGDRQTTATRDRG